jgi:hypothetical protein
MVNGCRGVAAASASARAALQFNSSNVAFSPHFRRISSLMAAKAEKTEFIDNTARRKWDKEECVLPNAFTIHRFHMQCRYERRAKERAERDEAAVVEVIFQPISLCRSFFLLACISYPMIRSRTSASRTSSERRLWNAITGLMSRTG